MAIVMLMHDFYKARDAFLKVGWPKNVLSREAARNILGPLGGSGGMLPQKILKTKCLRLA